MIEFDDLFHIEGDIGSCIDKLVISGGLEHGLSAHSNGMQLVYVHVGPCNGSFIPHCKSFQSQCCLFTRRFSHTFIKFQVWKSFLRFCFISELCGRMTSMWRYYHTLTNRVKLRFMTDGSARYEGFRLKYTAVKRVFTEHSGVILSPSYPDTYPENIYTEYHINVSSLCSNCDWNSRVLSFRNC